MTKEKKLHYYYLALLDKTLCGKSAKDSRTSASKVGVLHSANACATCKRILEKEDKPEKWEPEDGEALVERLNKAIEGVK